MPKKSIEEMLMLRDEEGILEIGEVARKLLQSQAGVLLTALVNGVADEEQKKGEDNLTQSRAEFRLGRISGAKLVLHRLERCIYEADSLKEKRKASIEQQGAINASHERRGSETVYKGAGDVLQGL
jgi:hypothetical protein